MSAEKLVEINREIGLLWEDLESAMPAEVARLRQLIVEKKSIINEAKTELRGLGVGSHQISGYRFEVQGGKPKKTFDVADVIETAEELGQTEKLIKYGFLDYSVNVNQLDRLPTELKVVYEELATEKASTTRVIIPKDLQ